MRVFSLTRKPYQAKTFAKNSEIFMDNVIESQTRFILEFSKNTSVCLILMRFFTPSLLSVIQNNIFQTIRPNDKTRWFSPELVNFKKCINILRDRRYLPMGTITFLSPIVVSISISAISISLFLHIVLCANPVQT